MTNDMPDSVEEVKEHMEAEWQDAQVSWSCSCHKNPPCNFCLSGFSLPLNEFTEVYLDDYLKLFAVSKDEDNPYPKPKHDIMDAGRGFIRGR